MDLLNLCFENACKKKKKKILPSRTSLNSFLLFVCVSPCLSRKRPCLFWDCIFYIKKGMQINSFYLLASFKPCTSSFCSIQRESESHSVHLYQQSFIKECLQSKKEKRDPISHVNNISFYCSLSKVPGRSKAANLQDMVPKTCSITKLWRMHTHLRGL